MSTNQEAPENIGEEHEYNKNFAEEFELQKENKEEKELLYNEEEEIVSSLDQSEGSNQDDESGVSIKLENGKEKNENFEENEIKSENSDGKDIFIENLENIADENFHGEDQMNELLFCCQNIGKFLDENRTKYEKDQYCESNLRDIHRMLVKEDSELPLKRYSLMKWKIVENDIIPLLLTYKDNHRVQLLSFVILVDMTQSISDSCQHRQTLIQHLTATLSFISNNEDFFKHLGNLIYLATTKLNEADNNRKNLNKDNLLENLENLTETQKEEISVIKKKIAETENQYQQLMELIFTFLKQIFNVYHPQESWKNCEINLNFIKKMFENKIFDAINYHTTNFESEFYRRIAFNFLELLHFIFREFSVTQIFEVTNKIDNNDKVDSLLKRLRDEEKKQKEERLSRLPTRHNNFGTSIQVKRSTDNTSYIVTNVNSLFTSAGTQEQTFDFQKKKPKPRYANKKYANEINDEIKFINDMKIKENFIFDPSNSHVLVSLRSFCTDFLKLSFARLIKFIFEEIVNQSERIEKYDIYYFFSVISFLLEFHRFLEHDKFDKEKQKILQSSQKNVKKPILKINLDSLKEIIKGPLLEFA